jgi:uncharacterized protein
MTSSQDSKLDQITGELIREYRPSRLFLYGSRANGNARPDSDYDFVMVLPEFKGNRFDMMSTISKALKQSTSETVQVWVYSQEDFDALKDDFSSIPETAMNTGREIGIG